MKKISIVSTCFNEENTIENFEKLVSLELQKFDKEFDYEIIVSDNDSTDNTINKLINICNNNKKFKVILNKKNYGPDRSQFSSLLRATGDIIIGLNIDLQEGQEIIGKFVEAWKKGSKFAVGKITKRKENLVIKYLKKYFYLTFNKFSRTKLINNTALFMIDQENKKILESINDPDPFTRGLLMELLEYPEIIPIIKNERKAGKSKSNLSYFYSLGIMGFVKMSDAPMRIITFLGFILSIIFLIIGLFFLLYKLVSWDNFALGIAPLIILLCLISSFLLLSLGIIGEYILVLLSFSRKLPLVSKKKEINFDN